MTSRYELEVTITSAKDLKNVNWRHGPLSPYAVVWIDPDRKCSTPVDDDGDTSPSWDHRLTLPFDSPVEDSTLHVDVVHAATSDDDGTKPVIIIGSAKLHLRDVIDHVGFGGTLEKWLELKRPSGRPQGKVEVRAVVRQPQRYPAPPQAYGARDYPAAPYASPYGAPPAYGGAPSYGQGEYYGQQNYGYGQGQGNYGYGQGQGGQSYGYVEGEEKKKSKFGGMGTGLAVGAVAGVLGGIALVEGVDALEDHIEDDVADRVEDDLGGDDGDGDDY